MNSFKKIKPLVILVSVFIVCYSIVFYVSAIWTDAPGAPIYCPTGTPGCDAPINLGSSYQIKTGILQIKNPDVSSADNLDGNWFHSGGVYDKTFVQAQTYCANNGARLAYYSEIVDAFKNGASICSWGWVAEGFAVYPFQNCPTSGSCGGCGGDVGGVRVTNPALATAYCARDSLAVNGSVISGGTLHAKGIYLNNGQTAGEMYFGLLANGSNADKLGICIGGVCKTSWDQNYWQDGGSGNIYYNSGNVGIGIASPGYKLDISSSVSGDGFRIVNSGGHSLNIIDSKAGSEAGTVYKDGGTAKWATYKNSSNGFDIYNYATGHIQIQLNSSDNTLLNQSGGNVGIGTASPSTKLAINGGDLLVNNSAGGDANSGLRIISNIATTHTNWKIGAQSLFGGFEITPSTVAGGTTFSTPALAILTNGNVGIGTTNPSASKLQVEGAYNIPLITATYAGNVAGFGVDAAATYWGTSLFHGSNKVFTAESNYGILVGQNYQSQNAPYSGAIIEGNVGIGTIAPVANLHVLNASAPPPYEMVILEALGSASNRLDFRRARGTETARSTVLTGDTIGIVNFQSWNGSAWGGAGSIEMKAPTNGWGGNLGFWTSPSGSSGSHLRMIIMNNGNIGIATSTPIATFEVDGTHAGVDGRNFKRFLVVLLDY